MKPLVVNSLNVQLAEHQALRDISASFSAGEIVALVGPNGAGKSTLLRTCAGLLERQSGSILVDGEALGAMTPLQRARTMAYLAPDGRSAWPMEARQIVALGRIPHLKPLRSFSAEDEAAIETALERAGMIDHAHRRFDTLSSGEKARILLARALASQARIFLLDEPVAALDPKHQLSVMEMARAEAARGALVIFSIHALDLAAACADRVIVLDRGAIRADGPPAQALAEDVVRQVFGVTAPGGITPSRLGLPA